MLFDTGRISNDSLYLVSHNLRRIWNPFVSILGSNAEDIKQSFIDSGVASNDAYAQEEVMARFEDAFEMDVTKSKTGFNADVSTVYAVGTDVPKAELIIENRNSELKLFVYEDETWSRMTFEKRLLGGFLFCIFTMPVDINVCFRSFDLNCSVPELACAVSDCQDLCTLQQCIAHSNSVLTAWIPGSAIGYLERNSKMQSVAQKLLNIKKHIPASELYGYGPNSLLQILKVDHSNIDSGTSTAHKDFDKRLMNTFIGNDMGVNFKDGGFVSIEFPRPVKVNCAAVACHLQDTPQRPVMTLFAYVNSVRILLLTGHVDASNTFKKFEFNLIESHKFELHVNRANTGFAYARLGLIPTSNVYSNWSSCIDACGGTTYRIKNKVQEQRACPVECDWVASPWSRCTVNCTQTREVYCGEGLFRSDYRNCTKVNNLITQRQCYVDDCTAVPGSDKFYETMKRVPYRLKYKDTRTTWNWKGGQHPDGEYHALILALKMTMTFQDIEEHLVFKIGDYSAVFEYNQLTIKLKDYMYFDYNQGRQNNTIGKVLYIAISAADPSKPTMSAVSVRFDNNNWITEQVRNEWWTGDKSITMSPMITAMYWYSSRDVEIPLSDLQFAAECLVQC